MEKLDNVITQLNNNSNGATYQISQPNKILGSWKQDAQAQGALGGSSIDLSYQVIVTINDDNTFSYNEKKSDQKSNSSVNVGTGTISFGGSSSSFSGKTFGTKSAGFTMHPGGHSDSNSYSYSLEVEKIKQPLLQALEQAGYQQKKGFFSKLFGR